MNTHMDALVIDGFLLLKVAQPEQKPFDRDAYLADFELD
jgi:hypothetical protein